MQETPIRPTRTEKPVVIDVRGEPVGVLVREGDAFRFLAVKLPAFAIDGQSFATIESARRAARALPAL